MTHGSLFSGIGGFDLSAQWMGWENKFHCEWNEFGQRVLRYYWPKATSYEDITKTDFTIWRGKIDILTGGFPCQPYSTAGKRLGTEDDRHLWPEMLRAVREIRPTWVVGENVLGLVNWNGGLVFEEVQADLEAEGYEVQSYILPAASVNAPHRRDRVWIVAYDPSSDRRQREGATSTIEERRQQEPKQTRELERGSKRLRSNGNASNAPSQQSEWVELEQREVGQQEQRQFGGEGSGMGGLGNAADANGERRQERYHAGQPEEPGRVDQTFPPPEDWQDFPTQSPVCHGDDGFSERLGGITFPKWRNESNKAGGNAIVPQVAYQIFKSIQQYEDKTNTI